MATGRVLVLVAYSGVLLVSAAEAQGQSGARSTTIVNVKGGMMRVWLTKTEQREPGEPLIILESGAGAGLDYWTIEAVAAMAQSAPVLAYDRRGIGESAPDSVRPTMRRVSESLHDLLDELGLAAPDLLVGASWGGALIRGFAATYPGTVAGMVYLDAVDIEATRERRAAVLPQADRKGALEPPTLPPIPPDTPPGLRAEYEQIGENMLSDFAEARTFQPPSRVPVAVVIATPPGRLKPPHDALVRLQIRHQGDWALGSSKGLLIVSGSVGHNIQRDDPALVVQSIRHVLEHASSAGR